MRALKRDEINGFKDVRLVVDGESVLVGVWKAWDTAQEQGLDLILVSDTADPPVVRVGDFKKLEYERVKKLSQNRKPKVETKEIQLRINISDHDFETKMKAAEKFLTKKHRVKIVVRLKGREKAVPQRATELLDRVAGRLNCKVTRIPNGMLLEPV